MKAILSLENQSRSMEWDMNELLSSYHEPMYWMIRKWVVLHEDAQDVLQNTWLKIYRGLPKFKGDSALSTWMYRIAYNESVRFLKKKKKHYRIDNVDSSYLTHLTSDIYFDPDSAQLLFHRALGELKELERHVFTLKYKEDITFSQMSDILSMNQNSVKTLYYKAEKKIKKYLDSSL